MKQNLELEVKNKASLMRREGRTPDYGKERKSKYMDMGFIMLKKVRNFLEVREEGKEEKMRMKCGLVMHQRPRLSI